MDTLQLFNLTFPSSSSIEVLLRNSSFITLFISMIFYWIQTAFSSNFLVPQTNVNFGSITMILSNFLLMFLLIFRWNESGHFPLSNLYESLMFLSWSCTLIHFILAFLTQRSFLKQQSFSFPSGLLKGLQLKAKKGPSNRGAFFFFPIPLYPLDPLEREGLDFPPLGCEAAQKTKTYNTPVGGVAARSVRVFKKKKPSVTVLTSLIGSITSPSALFTNAFATFSLPAEMQKASPLVPALQSNWLMMHVTVMIISYSALILGSLLSIAFLILITYNEFVAQPSVALLFPTMATPYTSVSKEEGRVSLAPSGMLSELTLVPKVAPTERVSKPLLSEGKSTPFVGVAKPSSREVHFTRARSVLFFAFGFATFGTKRPSGKMDFSALQGPKESPSGRSKTGEGTRLMTLAWNFDNLSYRVLGIGFPFLTIGILSGAVWANEAWGSYWSWDPKETWALLTWFIFAIYLHARITKGLRGKKPALIASLGFFAIWVCFLGVNLIGEGLHSYGWFSA